jgi:DNA-binding CsgD family transcriptional regulator
MAMLRSLPELVIRSFSTRESRIPARSSHISLGEHSQPNSEAEDRRPYHLLIAGFEALDLVNVGLVVISASGQLLLANRTAEVILESRDGIEVGPTGAIRTSLKSTPTLNALMDAVLKAGGVARDSVLPVRRPSGKRSFTAVVRAVAGGSSAGDPSAPAALLFILDPEISLATVEAELRQLFGLTSTEACLANLLMQGKSLDECCKVLDIRRSTARTHLQHLFEKVGVQRQSELVSLLLKSIGLVGPAVTKSDKAREFFRK